MRRTVKIHILVDDEKPTWCHKRCPFVVSQHLPQGLAKPIYCDLHQRALTQPEGAGLRALRVRDCLESELEEKPDPPAAAARHPFSESIDWSKRGSAEMPCEHCGNNTTGSSLDDGWYRCNACGYPGK